MSRSTADQEWLDGYATAVRGLQEVLKEKEPRYQRARLLGRLQGYGKVAQLATLRDWALGAIAATLDTGF